MNAKSMSEGLFYQNDIVYPWEKTAFVANINSVLNFIHHFCF